MLPPENMDLAPFANSLAGGQWADASGQYFDQRAAETIGKEVRSTKSQVVKLRKRRGKAPRDRLSGAGLKSLQAAVVKSHGGKRWSQSSRKYLEQVCVRETNESKPIEDASLNIQMSSKPGAYGPSGMSLSGA